MLSLILGLSMLGWAEDTVESTTLQVEHPF